MKIGIVGAGQVGATAAYAMTMRGVASEIVLVDRKADLAVAQAHDILDSTPWSYPVRVRAGKAAEDSLFVRQTDSGRLVPSQFVLELILARFPTKRGYPIMRRGQSSDRIVLRHGSETTD